MSKKTIRDRIRAASILRSALVVHQDVLVEGLRNLIGPEADESMPAKMAASITRSMEGLIKAESFWGECKGREAVSRRKLKEVVRVVYDRVSKARILVEGACDKQSGGISLKGETSRDPVLLMRQAAVVHMELVSPKRSFTPREAAGDFDPQVVAKPLQQGSKQLEQTYFNHLLAKRRVQVSMIKGWRVVEEHNELFIDLATFTSVLYRRAGRPELARVILPSKRLRGLTLREDRARRKRSKKAPASGAAERTEEPTE